MEILDEIAAALQAETPAVGALTTAALERACLRRRSAEAPRRMASW